MRYNSNKVEGIALPVQLLLADAAWALIESALDGIKSKACNPSSTQ